jgi:N-acetylmuramoyl-L-alanine amidase
MARLTAIRFWSLGDATRIAIQVDGGDLQYKYDRLENPSRLFFDIEGVRPEAGSRRMRTIPVGDAFVKQIRVAETQPGTTRVVLDLNRPIDYSASQLTNPNRLIIEIRPESGAPSITRNAPPDVSLPDKPKPPEIQIAAPRDLRPEAPPQAAVPLIEPPISAPPATAVARAVDREAALTTAGAASSSRLASAPAKTRPSFSSATPLPARTRGTDPSLTRVLGLKLAKVVIDPGHGGHDTGTHGASGFTEKDLVLDVAKRLGSLIEARLGSEVVYTRTDDTFIPLEERTRIANEHKADLFLSIHANSSPVRTTSGVETYYLNFTTNKAALEVAARENAASQHSIYDLKDLVEKIARKDKIDESREFAQRVQASLAALSARSNSRSRDRGVRTAPFVVLIGASMPSILAEIGFLTNAHDENLMRKPEYRQKLAEAIYKGVAQYAATLSHFQLAGARTAED